MLTTRCASPRSVVRRMLPQDPAEQITAAPQCTGLPPAPGAMSLLAVRGARRFDQEATMYIARFSYDVPPVNRERAIEFIHREVEAARRDDLDARLPGRGHRRTDACLQRDPCFRRESKS